MQDAETATVGRIVHYVSYGTPGGEYQSECRAAIVTGIEGPGELSLTVFNPSGLFFNTAHYRDPDQDRLGGSWHWPERSPLP